MNEPIDGSRRAGRTESGESTRLETALLVFVVLAVLFVASAVAVALLLL